MGSLRVGLFSEVARPVRNGVVASVEMLGDTLRARGHRVVCVTPTMPGDTVAWGDVVRLPSLPLPTRTGYRLTLPILTRENVAALGDLSLVHAHSPFVTGRVALRVARCLRVPLVFTYHTQLEEYAHYAPFAVGLTRLAVRGLTRAYANAADVVIVPTAAMECRLRELGVNKRIEIVPTGIDIARFGAGKRRAELRARFGVPPEARFVLWVGRLGREKNPSLALDAFARCAADAHLVIVGAGVERAALERAAVSAAPGRVHFAGEQPRDALPDIYATADVFLFTSVTETQGIVLLEALAAGLPIVAVDMPQTREVTGESARFCAPDAEALAENLRAVFAQEHDSRERSLAVVRRYEAGALVSRMIDVYASVLS